MGFEDTTDLIALAVIFGVIAFIVYEVSQGVNSLSSAATAQGIDSDAPGLASNAFDSISGWFCTLTGIGCKGN